jgi:TPR repeat protein
LAFFWSYLEPPLSQPTVWGTARGDPSIHFCGIYEYEKAAQRPAGSSEAPQEAKAAPVEDSKPSAAQPEVIAKAEAGDAASQNLLGVAYCKHGKDVPQDYAKAAEWFRKAADQGLDKAQRNLAVCYENGQGVRQDYARAAMWYRKAAEQGDVQAQYKVGVMYAVGQGVPRDYAQGAIWSRKAAEQGNVNAQFNIGLLYEKGQGVLQDYAQAAAWLRKAVEQGDTEAKSALDRVQREAEETKVK